MNGWHHIRSLKYIGQTLLLLTLALVLSFASAQPTDEPPWAVSLTKQQRFLAFPHIDAGFRALGRKDLDRAVQEFSRANTVAPNQPVIVGYLAESLIEADQLTRATTLVSEQLARTPDDEKLKQISEELVRMETNKIIAKAQSMAGDSTELRRYLTNNRPDLYSPFAEQEWLALLLTASTPQHNLLAGYELKFDRNETTRLSLIVKLLVRDNDLYEADQFIEHLPASFLNQHAEIDSLSYGLLTDGYPTEALGLLIKAYPFESSDPEQRQMLLKRMIIAQSTMPDKSVFQRFVDDDKTHITTAAEEREWLELMSTVFSNELSALIDYRVKFADNRALYVKDVLDELKQGAPLPNARDIQAFLDSIGKVDISFSETLSYRLFADQSYRQAWAVIMSQYPFDGAPVAAQKELFDRLQLIAQRNPKVATTADRRLLSQPLPSARERGYQVNILGFLGDCAGIRQVLGSFSGGYGVEQWLLLGGCYERAELSGLAQYAYEKAVSVDSSEQTERALAYAAFQNDDYLVALKAWQRVFALGQPEAADLIAAATTALAANKPALARDWLTQWSTRYGAAASTGTDATERARVLTLSAQAWSDVDPKRSLADMTQAISLVPSAERYLELGEWQLKQGDKEAALVAFKKAIELAPENGLAQAELGFLYNQLGQLSMAQTHLTLALKQRPGDPELIQQLAYVDQKLGDNVDSMRYIRLAVDHMRRFLPTQRTPEMVEREFGLRRMYEDLDRRWTFSFDALVGTGASYTPQAPQPDQGSRSYSQIEVDYRLGNPAIDNGKTFSVYSRVFGGNGADNSPWPIYAPTLGVGLRWKPFSEQVLYLAIEKQVPLDHGTSAPANTMLRASASLFNAGRFSDDWHPTGQGWMSQNLYLDSAYYFSGQAYSLLADYRIGYHNKLKEGQTLEPYARLTASKVSDTSKADIRAGVGVRWNIWGLQSRYSAYASQGYVGLEVQGAIQTAEQDRFVGLFNIGVRW